MLLLLLFCYYYNTSRSYGEGEKESAVIRWTKRDLPTHGLLSSPSSCNLN